MSSLLPNLRTTIVPIATSRSNSATCVQRWFLEDSEFTALPGTYEPLVNGEKAFEAVHNAIANAKKSIEIICWGFQPSMYFIRNGSQPNIGKLLERKAAEGVEVRILGWEMPFNSAGFAGEGNLPGKGRIRVKSRALQSSTDEQFEEDREWFAQYAVSDSDAARRVKEKVPVFVSRGFGAHERTEIAHWVRASALDRNISTKMLATLAATATHHQKSVMVDYELPEAVGFVMGHNTLDEYWDTDEHSALNRTEDTKPAPSMGARGFRPRQDISCKLHGPILHDVHENFAIAWRKETKEDLIAIRDCKRASNRLWMPAGNQLMLQVVRTQAQEGQASVPSAHNGGDAARAKLVQAQRDHKTVCEANELKPGEGLSKYRREAGKPPKAVYDIQSAYMMAVNNVTRFIYIENQYFRWPPLAEHLKELARTYQKQGRTEPLYLFVVTNDTEDGVGSGTLKTQEMLASLGRAETIPKITKLRMISEMKSKEPPKPQVYDQRDLPARMRLTEWQAEIDRKTEEIKKLKLTIQPTPGLKVHVCSLVSKDSPADQPWTPVYVHSKLMIVDDVYTIHGSANINTRSMMVDSELNICHEQTDLTKHLRRKLWELHTSQKNEQNIQDDSKAAFMHWSLIIAENLDLRERKLTPNSSLVGFYYVEDKIKDLD